MSKMSVKRQMARDRMRRGVVNLQVPRSEVARVRQAAVEAVRRHDRRTLSFAGFSLLQFFEEHGGLLGLEGEYDFDAERAAIPHELSGIADELAAIRTRVAPTGLDARLAWLVRTLDLCPIDADIIGVLARIRLYDLWANFIARCPGGGSNLRSPLLGRLTGHSAHAIELRLGPGSPLVRSGLLVCDCDGDIDPGAFLGRIARMQTSRPEQLATAMLPSASRSRLEWSDFDHLTTGRELVRRAVARAAKTNTGVNILLHGTPGTGKTELTKLVAQELGLKAVFAGLVDERGGEPTRSERLAHLNVLRGLTKANRDYVIVVDEADDVLVLASEDRREQSSKLWLNRLVEDVHAPTIWIVNDPALLGDTVVRRMNVALRFDLPSVAVRTRVLHRTAAAAGIDLAPAETADIAALEAAPAIYANAARMAQLAGGGGATVLEATRSILAALGAAPRPTVAIASAYDPRLSQADHDLADLARRMEAAPSLGWSMLLAGPSGTGKSAYARHLARTLGIEVEECRGSDLLSPFVGGTEANIAAAFDMARDRGAMLLIDEADSFLFDRRGAHRSWETSMVNEMLRWMETLAAPFVATTNLIESLDPATQRRFTMRIMFRPLTPAGAANLFHRYFGQAIPAGNEPLDGSTPGDFAVVAHRATLLGETDPARLLSWVSGEIEARGQRPTNVGFHLPALDVGYRREAA